MFYAELTSRPELTCWDNEGDAGDAGDATDAAAQAAQAAADAAAQAAADAGKAGKTFTQDELNKIVGKEKMALKEKFETIEANYENILKQQGLAEETRKQLESDRERLRTEMMTEKQRLEHEKKVAAEKYETDLAAANEKASYYQSLFESSTINREIQDSAIKADGFSAEQFINYLGPKTEMVDEMDAKGEKTGRLVPRVKWQSVDPETGGTQTVLKTTDEAVQLMKDSPSEFGNMFRAHVAAGIGAGTAPGQKPAGRLDISKLTTEEYMNLTPEQRRAAGLPT
jgi:hypothetical protein